MYKFSNFQIQEKDYKTVINCLSNHIPKIFDESFEVEDEIVFMRSKGKTFYNDKVFEMLSMYNELTSNSSTTNTTQTTTNPMSSSLEFKRPSPTNQNENAIKQRQITLPLLIPDVIEYCITGLYNMDTFQLIIPTLIDIMFYESG